MNISDYQDLDGDELKDRIRTMPRSELDEQIRQFGGQFALLCQRLEAVYAPDRLDQFMAIRPGGLDEIDKAIAKASTKDPKELSLLKAFRELNRILLPFMDVYEEYFLNDMKYLPKDELERLNTEVQKELASARASVQPGASDDRRAQNAAGTLRLATLMQETIRHELQERFGVEPDDPSE